MNRNKEERCIFRPGGLDLTERLTDMLRQMRPEWEDVSLSVLDIGCGEGASIRYLHERHPSWEIFGVDPEWEKEEGAAAEVRGPIRGAGADRIAAAEAPVSIYSGTAENLPFAADRFDVLLIECTFSRVEDPDRSLSEMLRVMRPEGVLLMSDLYLRPPKESRADGGPTYPGREYGREILLCGKEGGTVSRSLPGGEEKPDRLQVGALRSAGEIRDMLEAAGFRVLELRDVSRVLGEMTAQAILDGTCGELETALGWSLAELRRVRCGYFLCAAERS